MPSSAFLTTHNKFEPIVAISNSSLGIVPPRDSKDLPITSWDEKFPFFLLYFAHTPTILSSSAASTHPTRWSSVFRAYLGILGLQNWRPFSFWTFQKLSSHLSCRGVGTWSSQLLVCFIAMLTSTFILAVKGVSFSKGSWVGASYQSEEVGS